MRDAYDAIQAAEAGVRQMKSADPAWDVVQPTQPCPMPGLSMAGFRDLNAARVEQRVVPRPDITLILEFGDGSLSVDDPSGRRQPGGLVAGLDPGERYLRGDRIECVEVRLSPVVVHAVLGVAPAELTRAVVAIEDLWGRDAARIREQLGDAPSWQDRFAVTEAALARRCESGRSVDPEVNWAWRRIVDSRGGVRVEELAVEVGWSRKRLWSRFRSQVGLPPKRAAKLVRFDHAAHRLAAGASVARVAAEYGYVDQPHLHRDVVAFTGMTPAALAGNPELVLDGLENAEPPGTFVQDS
ncbi:AraC family transcriptional regulator [Mycolicibacterium sp. HK-90]|uniref:helix-turn-helix domain-containing protein n=1 Tax=Mycolicibacterium sp. HK-90 TaxID=3056937 RepID=UPI002659EFE4|nr:helix-turn-helix domain-containing protein [Mycolicibacterium sp. HK-90]WKG04398.1 helix-turn-helix domain-containing protein [Mycolicibacterium sp. HK-90]